MTCKRPPSCVAALDEASVRWPGRSTAGDGICGDSAHAARKSDHNPDSSGYAHAFDLTRDKAKGCDTFELAKQLAAKRDPRVKYIISNGKIWDYRFPIWRPYFGADKHVGHMHVSIKKGYEFDKRPWWKKKINMKKKKFKIKLNKDGKKNQFLPIPTNTVVTVDPTDTGTGPVPVVSYDSDSNGNLKVIIQNGAPEQKLAFWVVTIED
jgi:hypothetical protein